MRILVFSSLFPSAAAPTAGTFIRERAFRVAKNAPMVVVAPQPWSPVDWLIRRFRRSFRPQAVDYEVMDGIEIHRPRYLSVPGVFKRLDGRLMAAGAMPVVRRLARSFRPDLIDAHFLYPDGYAASLVAARLGLPLVVTLRGSKDQNLLGTDRERFLRRAIGAASRVVTVSDALRRDVAMPLLGGSDARIAVVPNGVDIDRFRPVDRGEARQRLGLPTGAPVLIGVGNLVTGKGFQRVIPMLPALRRQHPGLRYLIVGGGATHGDMAEPLAALARAHGVADCVTLCGAQPQESLKWYYGAADLFVLATEREGWANVFLEAMACGIPVVTTDVGGNREVVADPAVGTVVPYWDASAFQVAITQALARRWDRDAIRGYAKGHGWDQRISTLMALFAELVSAKDKKEER
ncbi:MAG: glycosyltransferase [Burkholderiaceae bacterium]|nr:glycosyltransferase [Burkholderiaceae bacterium]